MVVWWCGGVVVWWCGYQFILTLLHLSWTDLVHRVSNVLEERGEQRTQPSHIYLLSYCTGTVSPFYLISQTL